MPLKEHAIRRVRIKDLRLDRSHISQHKNTRWKCEEKPEFVVSVTSGIG